MTYIKCNVTMCKFEGTGFNLTCSCCMENAFIHDYTLSCCIWGICVVMSCIFCCWEQASRFVVSGSIHCSEIPIKLVAQVPYQDNFVETVSSLALFHLFPLVASCWSLLVSHVSLVLYHSWKAVVLNTQYFDMPLGLQDETLKSLRIH